jgi:hypothetical protein
MNRFAFAITAVFVTLIGVSITVVTFQKCGWKTFLLGNGASMAAMTGMCDEK